MNQDQPAGWCVRGFLEFGGQLGFQVDGSVGFEEVEPDDKERDEDDGSVDGFEAAGGSVFFFEGSVKAFNELLEDAEFGGFGVEVFEPDDGFVLDGKSVLLGEVLGQLVDGASVGDEEEFADAVFDEGRIDFLEVLPEGLGGVLGIAVEADGLSGDELLFGDVGEDDVTPSSGDTDVSFVGDEVVLDVDGGILGKGEEPEGGGFDVVEDGLMGDRELVEVLEDLLDLSGGLAELDVVVEDDGDDGDGGMDFGQVHGGLDGEIGIGFEEFCGGFAEDVIDLDEVGISFSELFFVVG